MVKNKILKVVKLGSHVLSDSNTLNLALKAFSKLSHPKILVHGGGSQATKLACSLGISCEMVNGRRITTAENLEVVTMVYAGLINKQITASLQHLGCNAMGLSGADGNCITSVKRPVLPIDYGYVGDINYVNAKQIELFLNMGLVPVFCSITYNQTLGLLNTNGDSVAAEIAIAMSGYYTTKLFYCFEKPGVLKQVDDNKSVIPLINYKRYMVMKNEKLIFSGMLPKLHNCFYALKNNVYQVCIGQVESMGANGENCTTLTLN